MDRAASALTALALLFLAIYLVIDHRHRASIKALIRSERALSASQRIARLGSWEAELAGRNWAGSRVLWSEEVFRILGYGPQDVEPSVEAFFRVVPPGTPSACAPRCAMRSRAAARSTSSTASSSPEAPRRSCTAGVASRG